MKAITSFVCFCALQMSAQQKPAPTTISTSGECSPVITKPQAPVTVSCPSAGMSREDAIRQAKEYAKILTQIRQTNLSEQQILNFLQSVKNDVDEIKVSTSGRFPGLEPGDEPTPENSCRHVPENGVLLFLGDLAARNVDVAFQFPHVVLARSKNPNDPRQRLTFSIATAAALPSGEHPVVSLDRSTDGKIMVLLDMRSADGRIIARMDENGFVVNPNNVLERKITKNTLVITDQFGTEVLNVRYINPKAISVSGKDLNLPLGFTGACSISKQAPQ